MCLKLKSAAIAALVNEYLNADLGFYVASASKAWIVVSANYRQKLTFSLKKQSIESCAGQVYKIVINKSSANLQRRRLDAENETLTPSFDSFTSKPVHRVLGRCSN